MNARTEEFLPQRRRAREQYLVSGSPSVNGWVSTADFALFGRLADYQAQQGVEGGLCEIGVFEGKRFIFFLLCLRPGELAVAVDVFDDTDPPRDFEATFRANVVRHAGTLEGVRILRRDSAEVTGDELLAACGGGVRIFSVDGCHSAAAVSSDLLLACPLLTKGGVLVVDDYFNELWPGVSEATVRYFSSPEGLGTGLVPFAIYSTKVFFSDRESADRYREHLVSWAGPFYVKDGLFLGVPVVTLVVAPEPSAAMRLAQSRLWRRLRGTRLGALIRKGYALIRA